MPLFRRRARSGLVIIFAVAMLALMSVLSVSFILYANLERNSGRNYVDGVRSLLLAESGVHHAVQSLATLTSDELARQSYAFPAFPKSVNVDYNLGSGAPLPLASDVLGASYTPDGDVCYVRVRDTSGRINLNDTLGWDNIDTDLWPDSWDGSDPDAFLPDSGDPDSLRRCRIYRMLRRVLNSPAGMALDDAKADALALRVVERRLTETFSGEDDVRGLLMTGSLALTAAESEQLLDFVTLDGWQDPNVLKPTFTVRARNPQYYEADYPGGKIAEDGLYSRVPIYRYQEFQTRHFEQEPRSPVNINSAPRAVIEALIADLQGWYLHEGPPDSHTCQDSPFAYFNTGIESTIPDDVLHFDYRDHINEKFSNGYGEIRRTPPISENHARLIAAQIHKHIHGNGADPDYYNPFKSFQQFELWLRGASTYYSDPYEQARGIEEAPHQLPDWGLDPSWFWSAYTQEAEDEGRPVTAWDELQGKRIIEDLILAAFNPNSMLNDFNPDYVRFYHVDKAQLIQYSTEICFEATGVFDIESEGRVYASPTECIARKTIRAKVKCFDMLRLTTQAQFMKGATADGGGLGQFFSGYVSGGNGNAILGCSLQSGPQPVPESPTDEAGYAFFAGTFADGYIQPAVLTVRDSLKNLQYSDNGYPFVCPFHVDTAASLALDPCDWLEGVALPPYYDHPGAGDEDTLDLGRNHPGNGSLTRGQEQAIELPVRYIDGAFSEAGRTLAYPLAYLLPTEGKRAIISFWFKPHFDVAASPRPRKFLSLLQEPFADPESRTANCFGCWYLPHSLADSDTPRVWLSGRVTPELGFSLFAQPAPLLPYSLVWGMRRATGADGQYDAAAGFASIGYAPFRFYDYPNGCMKHAKEMHEEYGFGEEYSSVDIAGHCWNHAMLAYDYSEQEHADDEAAPPYFFIAAYNGRMEHWGQSIDDFTFIYGPRGFRNGECSGAGMGAYAWRLAWQGEQGEPLPGGGKMDMFLRFGELPGNVNDGLRPNMMMADSTIDGIHVMLPILEGAEPGTFDADAFRAQMEQIAAQDWYSAADLERRSDAPDCWWGYWQDDQYHHTVHFQEDVANFHARIIQETFGGGRYQNDNLFSGPGGGYGATGMYTSPLYDVGEFLDERMTYRIRGVSYTYRRPMFQRVIGDARAHFQHLAAAGDISPEVVDPLDGVVCQPEWSANYFADYALPPQDPIGLNLWDTDAEAWVHSDFDPESCVIAPTEHRLDSPGSPTRGLRFDVQRPLRFKILFNAIAPGEALYEAPSFDDITFSFHLGQPRILSWTVID